jgi:phenylalanyl-tRNA synthetase beta subunit
VLGDDQATLTDDQIDAAVRAVIERLQLALGARLRA